MRAALFIVLAMSALAMAGPAFNNQITGNNKFQQETQQQQQQQQKGIYMNGEFKKTQATELLEKWCFASQMSQGELTQSFKKLVQIVKSQPNDENTEQAVMSGTICQGALVQKNEKSGETVAKTEADAQAHELIKDVYMDCLIACENRECMQQLLRIIESDQVDPIRASYYMTRVAVGSDISDKSFGIKDQEQVKQLAMNFVKNAEKQMWSSEIVERQQLLAVTGTLNKVLKQKQITSESAAEKKQGDEMVETAKQVAKLIVERYIKPVSQQEVRQYQEQPAEQQSEQLVKKMAKRSAALKALANMPAWIIQQEPACEQVIVDICENKDELSTVRQSAIECLEENEKQTELLKKITFDQDEPTEVRVAAYRALMTTFGSTEQTDKKNTNKQEQEQIIAQLIKHCESQQNQQQDEQFVLYVISHLNNVRTSQQPEVAAIKECLEENKQWLMQVQILCQKFKQQLEQIRKYSRNYKMEQQFNQLESGLIIEGDLVYESDSKKDQQSIEILPKVVRVNVSMPVMGETVNVIEMTLRQQNMDEQLLSTLKLVQSAKFNGPESMNKVVESFKNAAEKQQQQYQNTNKNTNQQQQQQQTEADLSIKIDGQTVIYINLDDFKTSTEHKQYNHQQQRNLQTGNKRQTRSVYGYQNQHQSIVEAIVEHLKREPIAFNRGINFNLNQRFAKLLDIEASLIAGLRFESRAQQHGQNDYEILVRAEPRVAFESIVGPAKMSSKKLLNRASTKSALGLRLRYKQDELVDFELELPMEKMELFNFEQQLVQSNHGSVQQYNYLEDSIYGEQDIYAVDDEDIFGYEQGLTTGSRRIMKKRSIFGSEERHSTLKSLRNMITGNKRSFAQTYESSEQVARLTGLRSALRVVVAPKEFGYRVSCVAQKVDPAMRSIRFQIVNKSDVRGNTEQNSYQLIVSTPGARTDRTTQIRVQQQLTAQRSLIKAIVESPMMTVGGQLELIHDGRQYSAKVELNGQRQKHTAEWGFQRGQQSTSGRIAATYKPYFTINSTELKRPIQMQAIVSCQLEPKTVIAYELKSMTSSANFIQGKITIDTNKSMERHYSTGNKRVRSMESPIVRMLTQDMTLVAELVAQLENHLVKLHHMTQWQPAKIALQADFTMQHKNSRKTSDEKTVSGLLKIDELKQQVQLECKYPQESRKDWRMQLVNECKQNQHQLVAELRYKQNLSQIVAYKHKLQVASGKPTQWSKFDLVSEVEFVASEWNVQEKLAGRTHVIWERQQKQVECELKSNDNKLVKISMDSNKQTEQHKCELLVKIDRLGQHQTILRSDKQTLLSLQSRTDCFRRNMMVQKTELDIVKPNQYSSKQYETLFVVPSECRVHVQMPTKQLNVLVDAQLESGKQSQWIVESPVFVSRGEFSFEKLARQSRSVLPHIFRFKSEARDLISKDAYWVESHLARDQPSFVRANSPIYAAEMSFEPELQSTKMNLFARNKRSVDQFDEIYSTKSFFGQQDQNKPLELANKLWAIRSIISRLPAQQKKNILSAVFEFLGREASHKHSFEWNPIEKRANFDFAAQSDKKQHQQWSPLRATGRLETRFERPSAFELDANQWGKYEVEAKPFDGETAYAKMNALSRHPRSIYKKHESEIRYEREHGLRGQLKHEDRDSKMHSLSLEADRQPQKWAKIQMDSEKHGKAAWEHKWRHESAQSKKHTKRSVDQESFFDNSIKAEWSSPRSQMNQRHNINWQEPTSLTGRQQQSKFTVADYLKNVEGRISSQYNKQEKPVYEAEFDYKPASFFTDKDQQQNIARLNMRLANEWDHKTNVEFVPSEQTYKLSSRSHVDSPAREQIYDLSASTRGLATEQQEPLFFNDKHADLDQYGSSSRRGFATLFKQPLKLDYTDKFGRAARFDYDHSPVNSMTSQKFAGLRQKRAALFYKDQNQDLEHQSSLDFYPEILINGQNDNTQKSTFSAQKPGQMTLKTHTKYGPVVAQIDSDESACELKLSSPVMNVKLTSESAGNNKRVGGAKLYKLNIDNTNQKMSVEKFLRQLPVVGKCQIAKEAAKQFDQARFEHTSEVLISFIESIIKIKSETRNENRPVMTLEAEWNKPQEKLIVKVDGKRCCDAQLVVDMVTKSAQFSLKSNDKHQINHQTRIVKLNDKFYSVESMTIYKQKPIFKFNGKLAVELLEEPMHFFSHNHHHQNQRFATGLRREEQQHVSQFEAIIYEPKPISIQGELECEEKQVSFLVKDMQTQKVEAKFNVQLDRDNEHVLVEATVAPNKMTRTTEPHYIKQVINIAPLTTVY